MDFATKLNNRVRESNSLLCIGLDPHSSQVRLYTLSLFIMKMLYIYFILLPIPSLSFQSQQLKPPKSFV